MCIHVFVPIKLLLLFTCPFDVWSLFTLNHTLVKYIVCTRARARVCACARMHVYVYERVCVCAYIMCLYICIDA